MGRWSDNDFVAYERQDWESKQRLWSDYSCIYACSEWDKHASKEWSTDFPEGARLKNYSGLSTNNYVNVVNGELKTDRD